MSGFIGVVFQLCEFLWYFSAGFFFLRFYFHGSNCNCLFSIFPHIKKKKTNYLTDRTSSCKKQIGALCQVAASKDVCLSISAGWIKLPQTDVQKTRLSLVFTLMLSKEVSVAFLAFFFLFFLRSRRQEVELWCCWCVIAVCGGSRGCISRCLASERVKGSGREA